MFGKGKKKAKSFAGIVGGLTSIVADLQGYEKEKRQEVVDGDIAIATIQADNAVATDEADKSKATIGNINGILGL